MPNILVLGGTNFVSSSLAKYLIKKGYNVDILTRGMRKIDYTGYRNHIICDRKSLNELQNSLNAMKYDYVFDISAYTKEDVEILLNSLDLSKLKKYIFCSSGAVYKQSPKILTESAEKGFNPNWGIYGTNKLEAENFIINSKIPYIILRPTYLYGANNNLYREAYFFHRIISKKAIPIPWGNDTETQFLNINDFVSICESAMNSSFTNRIYNVTHPDIVNWETLVLCCGKAMNMNPVIKKVNVNEINLESRSYFPFRDVTYLLSIDKLIEDKLYLPTIPLTEGLKAAYQWYIASDFQYVDDRMTKLDELIYSQ